MLKKIISLSLLVLAASCIYPKMTIKGKGNIKLTQVDFEDLNGWEEAEYRKPLLSFINSCHKFEKMPQNRLIGGQIGDIDARDFRDICDIAEVVKGMSNEQIKNFFQNWFTPFLVSTRSGNSEGLFTGYYEAELHGSKEKTAKYKYPIYARPSDLSNSEPYLSREQIENGALKNRGLELLYVDDKVELFFMHVQGSGRIILPSGAVVRLSFAGKNNLPYTSISNYFIDNKLIDSDKMSANAIKTYLKENPDAMDEALNTNPAFIFFKISDNDYVVGSQGVELTKEHSLAVDNEIIPYGLPFWVETKFKNKDVAGASDFNKLLIAQDSGSAIKGTVRGDIFFGHGEAAENKASSMASRGQYYIFLPNNIAQKIN